MLCSDKTCKKPTRATLRKCHWDVKRKKKESWWTLLEVERGRETETIQKWEFNKDFCYLLCLCYCSSHFVFFLSLCSTRCSHRQATNKQTQPCVCMCVCVFHIQRIYHGYFSISESKHINQHTHTLFTCTGLVQTCTEEEAGESFPFNSHQNE